MRFLLPRPAQPQTRYTTRQFVFCAIKMESGANGARNARSKIRSRRVAVAGFSRCAVRRLDRTSQKPIARLPTILNPCRLSRLASLKYDREGSLARALRWAQAPK